MERHPVQKYSDIDFSFFSDITLFSYSFHYFFSSHLLRIKFSNTFLVLLKSSKTLSELIKSWRTLFVMNDYSKSGGGLYHN
jgi:hypothetical protein